MNVTDNDLEFEPENIIINGQKYSFGSAIAHYGDNSGGHYTCVVPSGIDGGEIFFYEIDNETLRKFAVDDIKKMKNIVVLILKKL
jgi:ubiquitin C-terminal hydrolase